MRPHSDSESARLTLPSLEKQTQLAQAASVIISHFLVDLARAKLQQVLDEVDEKLRTEGGVEWGKDSDPVPPKSAATDPVDVPLPTLEPTSEPTQQKEEL